MNFNSQLVSNAIPITRSLPSLKCHKSFILSHDWSNLSTMSEKKSIELAGLTWTLFCRKKMLDINEILDILADLDGEEDDDEEDDDEVDDDEEEEEEEEEKKEENDQENQNENILIPDNLSEKSHSIPEEQGDQASPNNPEVLFVTKLETDKCYFYINCNLPSQKTLYFNTSSNDKKIQYGIPKSFVIIFPCTNPDYFSYITTESKYITSNGIKTYETISKLSFKMENLFLTDPEPFLTKSDLDDVTIIVGSCEFHLNKTILAHNSPVFKAMFYGQFQEENSDRVELKEECPTVFVDFLSSFYHPDPESSIEFMRARRLYPLYDKYQMEKYLIFCQDKFKQFYIHCQQLTEKPDFYVEEMIQHGILGDRYNLDWLVDCVVKELGNLHSKHWREKESWSELSEETRFRILYQRMKTANC